MDTFFMMIDSPEVKSIRKNVEYCPPLLQWIVGCVENTYFKYYVIWDNFERY